MKNEYKVEKTKLGEKTTHPSYGTIVFNRLHSSGERALFGSSIKHRNTISMELRHAEITRGLHQDWVYGDNLIARVEMSYSQFAEAITSFGQGSGIPVTINYTEMDGRIPECDFVSKREQFTDEFKAKKEAVMEESQQLLQDVVDLFSQKKTLTKSDKEQIMSKLKRLNMDISGNMDFIVDQFNEQMDKTVMEAKGEIESFCQNKINSITNAALIQNHDEILKLENPVDIETE